MVCSYCQKETTDQARFCPGCGKPFAGSDPAVLIDRDISERKGLASVFILYFILLLVCLILKFTHLPVNFKVLGTVDLIFVVVVSFFAVINFSELRPLLFSVKLVWWYFPLIMAAAVLSNIGIGYLVDMINSYYTNDIFFEYMYEDTGHPLLMATLGIAVQPAIFEELAFRGIIYNHLGRVMEPRSVILVTAFLFAILHLSLISVTWLVFFGILAAWMRKRTGTLWYGIAFHFIFNLTYVLWEGWKRGWFD